MVWRTVQVLGIAIVVAMKISVASAAEIGPLVKAIKSVSNEGAGSREAAKAQQQLGKEPASVIPKLLESFDDANPLAANYLRSAIEVIADKTLKAKGKLPAKEIEAFLADSHHDPRARRFAFELLVKIDGKNADRLVPGMLNDPSVELRREAVARKIEAGEAAREQKQDEVAKKTLREAMAAARDVDQVELLKKKLEELGEKVDIPTHYGFLMNWRLLAPFDNTGGKGFNIAYPPEKEVDFTKEYEGKAGEVAKWTPHVTEDETGIVDIAKALSPFKGAVAYAAAEFESDKDQAVDIRLGTPNSWKVWLNGKLLFARDEYHRNMVIDQYKMKGTLVKGRNVILIKACQNEQTEPWAQRWQLQLRVCDPTGTAILSSDRASTTAKPAGTGG